MNRLRGIRWEVVVAEACGLAGVALIGYGTHRLFGDWWMIVVGSLLLAVSVHNAWRRHGGRHPR